MTPQVCTNVQVEVADAVSSGDWAVPPMSAIGTKCAGHEGAGVVVKLGKNVKGWNVGDRAGIKPLMDVCHNCEQCWSGKENYCQGKSSIHSIGRFYSDSFLVR